MLKFMNNAAGDSHIPIPLGITVGLLASFVQSLGLTIQRKSHVQNQALPESERKVEHRRPLWLLGFGIFISSNLFGSVFQIASLPVVILAPLGAVSLLWNAFFARVILGDVFSPWMLLSTLCIAGGAVLIAVFGIVPEPTHSLEDLLELFHRPAFIVYFSLLGFFTIICLVITHIAEYSMYGRIALPVDTPPLSPLLVPHSDPTILTAVPDTESRDHESNLTSERSSLIDRKSLGSRSLSPSSVFSRCFSSSNAPVVVAMSYGSFSGIISGMCLLLAKSGVELLVLSVSGQNQFWRWESWVLVLGLVVCALLQLWYMHKSLVLADPTLVCPLAFCFYNLSSIINGLVYFDQFALLPVSHLLLVVLGMTILLAGVWIVSFPPTDARGIDLGAWSEPEEAYTPEGVDTDGELQERYEDEPLPMDSLRPSSRRIEDEELGRPGVANNQPRRTQSLASNTSDGIYPPQKVVNITDSLAGRPSESTIINADSTAAPTLPLPPSSPTRRRRPTVAPQSHTTLGHVPGASTSRQPYPQYTSPLSPSGFSIGLSPVSPGFSLVPRDRVGRRRRVTSVEGVEDFWKGVGRRAVSESSSDALARAAEDSGHPGGAGEHVDIVPGTEAGPRSGAVPNVPDVNERPVGQLRARWRWMSSALRNVVSRPGQ